MFMVIPGHDTCPCLGFKAGIQRKDAKTQRRKENKSTLAAEPDGRRWEKGGFGLWALGSGRRHYEKKGRAGLGAGGNQT
jgi:hypothetical protein